MLTLKLSGMILAAIVVRQGVDARVQETDAQIRLPEKVLKAGPEVVRLVTIEEKIGLGRGLSPADRDYAVRTVESPKEALQRLALDDLELAAQSNLYPKEDFRRLLDSRAFEKDALKPGVFAKYFLNTIRGNNINMDVQADQDSERLIAKSNPHTLGPRERQSIVKQLKGWDIDSREHAPTYFLQKQALDSPSVRWLQGVLRLQESRDEKQYRPYWEYVEKLVTRRVAKR